MARSDLSQARARLEEPAKRRGSAWGALGAGALAAASTFALCGAVVESAVQAPDRPRGAAVKVVATPVAAEERRLD